MGLMSLRARYIVEKLQGTPLTPWRKLVCRTAVALVEVQSLPHTVRAWKVRWKMRRDMKVVERHLAEIDKLLKEEKVR